MVEHYDKLIHKIAFSMSDASFWCFKCDEYITNPILESQRKTFSNIKFAKKDDLETI